MKTFSAKPQEVKHDWVVVDATDKVLGRLAATLAHRLLGGDERFSTFRYFELLLPSLTEKKLVGLVAWLDMVLKSGLTGDALKAATKWTYVVAGLISLALAAFSLTLPPTPPKKKEEGAGDSLGDCEKCPRCVIYRRPSPPTSLVTSLAASGPTCWQSSWAIPFRPRPACAPCPSTRRR